jgi:ParB family chromosome partitioning protein
MQELPVAQIRANPFQPRREFKAEELAELESSLRTTGLLQPITVRKAPVGGGYELIAGERRLRAATRLGWSTIPAVVKDADDRTLLTLALVENLQRSDLNPIEEAEGYRQLVEEFELTQAQVAEAVGKERTTIANVLRLLSLPPSVRTLLERGELTAGHGRALLTLRDEQRITALAQETVAHGLSVREVERRVMTASPERRRPAKGDARPEKKSAELRRLEEQIRGRLQTDVRISLDGPERGTISIAFYSSEDLERILDLVVGTDREFA